MEERTITMTVEEYKEHLKNEVRISLLQEYFSREKYSPNRNHINNIFGFEDTEDKE